MHKRSIVKRRNFKGRSSTLALFLTAAVAFPAIAGEQESAPVYYKGKGPGGNNSYSVRFEEDFSYLRDTSKATDFFDPIKFIPFDEAKQVYLTLGVEERLRYDNVQNLNFGLIRGANQREDYSRRTYLNADLHLGNHFRVFAGLVNGAFSGRNLTGNLSPSQRNDLALGQGFAELYGIYDGVKTGIRGGRQEIFLGNGTIISFPATSNVKTAYDAVRAYADWGHDRIDAIAGHSVIRRNNDLIQDSTNGHEDFQLAYFSHDFPTVNLFGSDARVSIDPAYMHFRSANHRLPGATGTLVGQDERHQLTARLYGDIGNFDFDWTAGLQRGSFAGYSIEASAVWTDWGYTLRDLPWKPRIGTHIDYWSGGRDNAHRVTNLWNPTYFGAPYLATTTTSTLAAANIYDVAPRIRVRPSPTLSAEFYWGVYWRYSSAEGVYGTAFWNGTALNQAVATARSTSGSYVGSLPDLQIRWTPVPHIAISGEIAEFLAGPVIKNAGGKSTTITTANITITF